MSYVGKLTAALAAERADIFLHTRGSAVVQTEDATGANPKLYNHRFPSSTASCKPLCWPMRKEKLCQAYEYKLPTAIQQLAHAGRVEERRCAPAPPGLAIISTTSDRLELTAANAKCVEELASRPATAPEQPKPL